MKQRWMTTFKHLVIGVVLALLPWLAQAREYGAHDLKRLLTVTETPTGKKYGFDLPYLDQILSDLGWHARDFPPRFDSAQDRQRATQDARTLSGMLDSLLTGLQPRPELLARAGFLNSLAYNLGIPGSGEKTSAIFQKLLTLVPADPSGNYLYGVFLAGANKPREALPYLEKALAVGVIDAGHALGMTYLVLEERDKALEHLEAYRQHRPTDPNIGRLIEAIRGGRVEVKRRAP